MHNKNYTVLYTPLCYHSAQFMTITRNNMATPYITIGCPTSGGGKVISGNNRFLIDGIPVACVGDKATCPTHKVLATIVSGDPSMQIFGKAAARVNDSLSCGCKLLPQQNLVVQDNGGGAGSNSLLKNTQQSTQENFVEKKDFEIELVDLKVTPFIPLGVPTPEGKPSNKEHSFFIKIKKGICDAISLEVEQDGTFVEVKKIQKAFSPSQQVSLTWDGFINDFYNSKFMTKPSGVKFKVKGYSSGSVQCTHEKIFRFKYFNKDWMDVVINRKTKHILIDLRVNFSDGGAAGLFNSQSVPTTQISLYKTNPYTRQTKSFDQLLQLAFNGINYYWSRNHTHPTGKNININGDKYEVFVKAKLLKAQAMPEMKLTFVTNVNPNDPMFRSSNWALSRKTAYITGYLKFDRSWGFYSYDYSDKKFKETIAHETGHAIVETYAGFNESVTHHGSSRYDQNPKSGTTYPHTGEIDLMKYAEEELSSIPNWNTRMVANEKDTMGLLFISGISKQ